MGERVYEGLTVGYCLALTQFVMVLVLGMLYLRKADKDFDPLAEQAIEDYAEHDELYARTTAARAATRRRRAAGRAEVRAMTVFAAVNVDGGRRSSRSSSRSRSASPTGRPSACPSADGFYAAGRQITGFQNGLAISGDYLSAASFLGIAGLIFLYGFDGFLYSIGFLVAFLTVMFLLAERMRNSGKYTIADVLAFRLRERPARVAAAIGTLDVAAFYLIAQMVGAGVLIQALVGIDFTPAVLITGTFMLVYVVFGGMVATTWVQIIKAVLLMSGIVVMSLFVLERVGFNPIELFNQAEEAGKAEGSTFSLGPGTFLEEHRSTRSRSASRSCSAPRGCRTSSCASSPCRTPRPRASSVVWAMFMIGFFYLLTTFIGFGARAILGEGGVEAAGKGGNLAAPNLAAGARRRRRARSAATCSWPSSPASRSRRSSRSSPGLVLSASSAVAHDIWSSIIRKGKDSEKEEVLVAKIAALAIGAIAIADRDHRRRGPERLVHGRPRVRDRGERELPGAAARADLAALQHDRRGHRRAVRRRLARSA